jgi:glycine/D-amino acid oxidase-like deaminating enzyme
VRQEWHRELGLKHLHGGLHAHRDVSMAPHRRVPGLLQTLPQRGLHRGGRGVVIRMAGVRVRAEKAKGNRAFLKPVAEEEGVSVSRLKRLVKKDRAPASTPPCLPTQSKGAILKAEKTKR